MALELEQIQPWDGQSGTGAEVRGALNRNFEKLKDLSILAGMPIKDLFTSVDLLPRPGISGNNYLVGENLYVWSESVLDYVDIGSVKGQDGLDGIDGKDSKQVTTVAYDGTRPVLRLLTDGSGVSYPVPTFSKSDGSTTTIITEAATYTNAEALSSKVDKGGSDKTLKQVEDEIVQLAGEKVSIIKSKNLFDVNSPDNQISKFLNEVYGNIADNSTFNVSHFIEVEPGTTYSHAGVRNFAYFTEKNYTSIISGSGGGTLTTSISPSTARYFAFSAYKSGVATPWAMIQVEKSNAPTTFAPFFKKIDENLLLDITDEALNKSASRSTFLVKSDDIFVENLFDKIIPELNKGKYVSGASGNLSANASYDSTDFIPVKIGQKLQKKNTYQHWAFYNSNKIFISGGETGGVQATNKITAPADGYFRFAMNVGSAVNEYLLTTHDAVSTIPTFGEKILKESLIKRDEIEIVLPSEIVVAVGRTIEIYNEQIAICGNINDYHFRWICEIGKGLKRKFSVTGVNPIQKTLTLEVYSNNKTLLLTKTTQIKVIPVLSAVKSLLCIGDSITNSKPWLAELKLLSNNNVSLVGTRGGTSKHEGRSGWTAASYLASTVYTYENEGVHPFWNATSNRFDWNYYKSTTGISPSAILINLGTNSLANITKAAADLKSIVDYIRQDDSTIPIHIALVHHWGNQNALGGQTSVDGFQALNGYLDLDIKTKVLKLNKLYIETFSGYTNLHFVPLYATMDRENNYGLVDTPVNPRQTLTEKMPTDSVHPQDAGYFQFADAIVGVLSK